ncbi:MAG: prepilin-type N-terminal cleavage/methylation domain-containing protein [Nitrospiraceae bacterium]|nr:prepilin-type N-terminal cleavage/methylation domain-containing protein [Nitrospiraceae bacterium]
MVSKKTYYRKNSFPANGSSNGFSLLEVLIAIAIVGILLVSIINLVNYHISVIDRYQTLSVASMLGKEKLNEMKTAPKKEEGSFPEPYQDYTYKSDIVNGPLPFLNELVLTVSKGRDETDLKMFISK